MTKKLGGYLLSLTLLAFSLQACSQQSENVRIKPDNERWQQAIKYEMEIDMDVETNRYQGVQKVKYTNNSPDDLNQVFYHLYFNAFQPESMMDVRSRTIADPDGRVRDRIFNLNENEVGYQKIKSLKAKR